MEPTTPSAHVCTPTSTHVYRPALHPPTGQHSYQRRYGPPGYEGSSHPSRLITTSDRDRAQFEVYRDATHDVAEVEITIGTFTAASIILRMTAEELREAAARLLDAAHDIETLPSHALQAAALGGEG